MVDGPQYQHLSTPNRTLRPLGGESDYDDSSLPLYSIYSKIAKDEDNRTIETTQKFTDGILIFVSSHISSQMTPRQLRNIEWFIRCYRWCTTYDLNPRSQAELARHLRILSTEHISASSFWQHKCFPSVDPIYFGQTTRILSAKICRLGERTLVPEPGY